MPGRILAPNPGPFTLGGTYTHLVGRESVVIIDPGPNDAGHLQAIAAAVSEASRVGIALTHDHKDHSDGADPLRRMLGCGVQGPVGSEGANSPLPPGARMSTDWGDLVAVPTPGHARHHLAFHWPQGDAVFVGDLLLGEGSTTWVGAYPGCVADYLASLERLSELESRTLFPAHGPPLRSPAQAISRFRAHRLERIAAVREVLHRRPEATVAEIVAQVYGPDLPQGAERAVGRSVAALVEHVHTEGGGTHGAGQARRDR